MENEVFNPLAPKGFTPFISNTEIAKTAAVEQAALRKKLDMNRAAISKKLSDALSRNRDRNIGEHAQDAASLAARAALQVGQVPYELTDFIANKATGGLVDIDQASESVLGNSISQGFASLREAAHGIESEPLAARRAEIARRSQERQISNEEFDKTNPSIIANAFKGIQNFGAAVGDLAEFGTVGLDTALESVPQALVPGAITTKIAAGVAKKKGKVFAEEVLKKSSTRKDIVNRLSPKKSEFEVGKSKYSIENGIITNASVGKELVKPSKAVKAEAKQAGKKTRREFFESEAGKKAIDDYTETVATIGSVKYLATPAGKKATQSIAAKTGLTYTAVAEGTSNAGGVKADILNTSEEDLTSSSKKYRELRKTMTHKDAKRALANEARDITMLIAGIAGGVAGKLTGASKLEGMGFKIDSGVGKSFRQKILGNVVVEGLLREGAEETLQGASGTFAGNVAESLTSDDNKKLSEGVVEGAATGLVAGVISGGGLSAAANITRTPGEIAKGTKKVANKISEAAVLRKAEPEAKAAIKNKEGAEKLLDKNPLAAAQVLLHKDTLAANKDNIKEHLATTQKQINLLTKDREDTRKEALVIRDKIIAQVTEIGDSEATPEQAAENVKLREQLQEINSANEERAALIEDFQVQVDKFGVAEAGLTSQKVNKIADTLVGKAEETIATSDLDDNNSESIDKTAPDGTVTKQDLEVLLGADDSVFTHSDEVLTAVENHPEASKEMKAKVKLIRELKDAKGVSAEISSDNEDKNSPEFTGIVGHIKRILRSPTNLKVRNDYEQFRDGIKEKAKHSQVLFDLLDAGQTNPSKTDVLSAQVFFQEFLDKDNKNTGRERTLSDLKLPFFKTLQKQLPLDIAHFDKADAFIDESLNATPTAANGTGASVAAPGRGASRGEPTAIVDDAPSQGEPLTTNTENANDNSTVETPVDTKAEPSAAPESSTLLDEVTTIGQERKELDDSTSDLNTPAYKGARRKLTGKINKAKKVLLNKFNIAFDAENNSHDIAAETVKLHKAGEIHLRPLTKNKEAVFMTIQNLFDSEGKRVGRSAAAKAKAEFAHVNLDGKPTGYLVNLVTGKIVKKHNKNLIGEVVEPALLNKVEKTIDNSVAIAALENDLTESTDTVEDASPVTVEGDAATYLGDLFKSKDLIDKPKGKDEKRFPFIENALTKLFKVKDTTSIVADIDNVFSRDNREDFQAAVIRKMEVESWEKLTPEQQRGATRAWQFTRAFIKDYRKSFAGIDPKNLQNAPTGYFAKKNDKGEYVLDDNVIAAMGLSAFAYMNNSLEKSAFKSDSSLRSLLGINESDFNISNSIYSLFQEAGDVNSVLVEQLGKSFMDILGVDIQNSTEATMIMDAGNIIMDTMADMGIMEYTWIPTEIHQDALADPRTFAEIYPEDLSQHLMTDTQRITFTQRELKSGREAPILTRFARPVIVSGRGTMDVVFPLLGKELTTQDMSKSLNDTESMGQKLLGVNYAQVAPSLIAPTEKATQNNKGTSDINEEAADIVLEGSQAPLVVNKQEFKLMNILGVKAVLNLIRLPIDHPDKIFNKADEGSTKAKLLQKERSILDFFGFMGKDEFKDNSGLEFYLPKEFWSSYRMGEVTNISPQGDKTIRSLFGYKSHNVTHTIDPTSAQAELDLFGFKMAVVQALSGKIDRMTHQQVTEAFDNALEQLNDPESDLSIGTSAVNSILESGNVSEQELLDLEKVTDRDGEHPLLKLNAAIALNSYVNAVDGKFDTNLYVELDGVTNGYAITLMQMFSATIRRSQEDIINTMDSMLENDVELKDGDVVYNEDNIGLLHDGNTLTDLGLDVYINNYSVFLNDGINQRFEQVGLFNKNSNSSSTGEYIGKNNGDDAYQDLARLLTRGFAATVNLFTPDSTIAADKLSSEIAGLKTILNKIMPTATYDTAKAALIKHAQNEVFLESKRIIDPRQDKISNAQHLAIEIGDAVNGDVKLQETLNALYEYSPMQLETLLSVMEADLTPQQIQLRVAGINELVGELVRTDNDNGLITSAVTKLGRNIAKPSLLISNYGASIKNIIRTFSEDVTNRIVEDLNKAQRLINNGDTEKAQLIIDGLNDNVNAIFPNTVVRFTEKNLTDVINKDIISEIQQRVQQTHGVALKYVLESKYGDLFDSRKKLNAITGLTFTLFDELYNEIKSEFLPENQQSMTKKQERAFQKKIVDIMPFYETYYSNPTTYSEGVFGPNTGREQQLGNPAYRVQTRSVDPKTRKGRSNNGYASEKIFTHPSARIPVMLTHALDAAVQVRLTELMNELGQGILNVHDAATFATNNPQLYGELYNQAFMEVMMDYSLPTAIHAPLVRIYEEMRDKYPHLITKIEQEINNERERENWSSVVNSGYLELDRDFADANIQFMVNNSQRITENMTEQKESFFDENTEYSVSQYAGAETNYKYNHTENKNVHSRVKSAKVTQATPSITRATEEQLTNKLDLITKQLASAVNALKKNELTLKNMHKKNPKRDGIIAVIQSGKDSINSLEDASNQIASELKGDFQSSPDSDFTLKDFKPDSTRTLNENNVRAVFDALDTKGIKTESATHKAVLSNLIDNVITSVLKPTTLYLRKKGDITSGAFSSTRGTKKAPNAVYVSYASIHPTTPNLTGGMSAQEVYAHELIHAVIGEALDSDGQLLSQANRLFEEVRDSGVDYTIFIPKGTIVTPAVEAEAQEKLDYIFANPRTHNKEYTDINSGQQRVHKLGNGLHEFMTYAVTNETFINHLKGIKIKNERDLTAGATLFEKAINLFNKILNMFSSKVLKKDFASADAVALNLVTKLSTVHEEHSNKGKSGAATLTNALWNGYSKSFDATIGKLAKVAVDKLRPTDMKEEEFKPENYYDGVTEFGKVLGSVLGAEHDGIGLSLLNELNPRSNRNSFIHTLGRNKNKLIDKAIQKLMSNVTAFFEQAFINPLNSKQKRAITRTVVKLDMQVMVNTHTLAEMSDLLTDKTKLAAEIAKYKAKLKADHTVNNVYYSTMAKNLGEYLVTESQTDHATMMNAHLIANLEHSGLEEEGNLAVAEKDIDILATLYGIQGNSVVDNKLVSDLMKVEPDAMQSVVDILKVNHEVRINNNFDGNPAQETKGYVKENYSQHLTFRIGIAADKDDMAREGFYTEMELSNHPGDETTKKILYLNKFADLSTRTSGAISLADNHTRGTEVTSTELSKVNAHYKAAVKNAAKGIHTPVETGENGVTPIVDSAGKVTDYRYTVSRHVKETLLEADTKFDSVIGRLETTTIVKPRTNKLNKELIQAAFDEFAGVDVASSGAMYAVISPNAKGKLQEYWHMLPEQAKKDAEAIFGTKQLILPVDGLVMAMGAPNWSTQSIKRKDISVNDPVFKQYTGHINNIAATLLNNPKANLAESLLREGVGFAKDAIVVKTGIVLLGNQVSNMISLMVFGITPRKILVGQAEAIKFAKEYAINADKLMQIKIKLRTKRNLSKSEINGLKSNEARLNTLINNNPVAELMDAGLHQTLVEDVGDLDDNPNSIGRIEKKLRGNKIVKALLNTKDNKYGNAISTVGSEILMTHNSGSYAFLRDGTQLSDFAARYVLHKHNVAKGMTSADSIEVIEDTFINYDLPSHPFLQLGNDLGFLMFTKFFFRIQPIIAKQAIKHPKQFLLMLLSQGLLGDVEDISDSVLSVTHLINKLNNPLGTIMDIPTTPLVTGSIF
jgi:hypothetical protein